MLRLTVLITALLVAGCGGTREDVVEKVFGGAENLRLMNSAAKVSACRLREKEANSNYSEHLSHYEEGRFVPTTAEQAAQFRAIFERPSTYSFGSAKDCLPNYGVRIRFTSDGGNVDFNLCFECLTLAVRRDGKIVGYEDFDGAEAELIALCQELFPDDPEIQKLGR